MLTGFILVLIVLIQQSETANILSIVPYPAYSHQIAFTKIWAELSKRGHQVTVVTTHPQNDKTLTNLTEIDVGFLRKQMIKKHDLDHALGNMENNTWMLLNYFHDLLRDIIDYLLDHDEIQKLLHDGSHSYDVVLFEALFPELATFGKIYNCPTIGVISIDATSVLHELMGNPTHPVANPDVLLPFSSNLNFKERLISTMYVQFIRIYWYLITKPCKQDLLNKHFKHLNATIDEVEDSMDMLFTNVHPVLQGVRPLGPSTIPIGGTTNIQDPKPLPKDLKIFMDSSKNGVIYFSLGSNVKSKTMNIKLLQTFLKTFANLPYNVLWKFEADLLDIPGNIKIIEWAPQQDILRHPNLKLFITQGGLQSMQEAIMSEIPMIAFPFFGDQAHNSKVIEQKGMGKVFNYKKLNKDEFKTAIYEVIKNPKYKTNVQMIKTLILDEPMSGVEKAVWWTEYVIRNKGAKHFRNPLIDISWIESYQLDVYSFIIATVLAFLYLLFIALRLFVSGIKLIVTICQRKLKRD